MNPSALHGIPRRTCVCKQRTCTEFRISGKFHGNLGFQKLLVGTEFRTSGKCHGNLGSQKLLVGTEFRTPGKFHGNLGSQNILVGTEFRTPGKFHGNLGSQNILVGTEFRTELFPYRTLGIFSPKTSVRCGRGFDSYRGPCVFFSSFSFYKTCTRSISVQLAWMQVLGVVGSTAGQTYQLTKRVVVFGAAWGKESVKKTRERWKRKRRNFWNFWAVVPNFAYFVQATSQTSLHEILRPAPKALAGELVSLKKRAWHERMFNHKCFYTTNRTDSRTKGASQEKLASWV